MDVEKKRWEMGKEAARQGQKVHDEASEEFRKGHIVGRGFGSNVTPRRFGAGGQERTEWTCGGCGTVNARYLVQCSNCGVHRSYTYMLEGEQDED